MRKSRVKLVIKGLNQERVFNKLSKTVQILKLDRQDKQTCNIEVAPKDAKRVKKLLNEESFEILEVQDMGAYSLGKKILSCYGVIAAVIICCIAYFVQLGFVWQIKVFGNDKLNADEITSFIKDNITSRYISKIDTKKLEIGLKDNFKRISSVSVAIVGQSLVINLNEAVVPDEMEGNFQPLISAYDCRITEIEIVQGTLTVKVGDIVRAGEVLVLPYIIDSEGKQRSVKPMASIKADVWFQGKAQHFDSYYQTSRTGKYVETSEVFLFGLSVYSNKKPVSFSQYEIEESTSDLNKNNLLPFKLKKTRYYETKTDLIEKDFESIRDEIVLQAKEKALQNLQECEIIKEEDFTITEAAGVHIVNFVITVNREIIGGT